MTLFQWCLLGFLGLSILGIVALTRRGSLPRGMAILLGLGCALGGVLVIQPELTTRLAAGLGIGRGADLMLYLLVVGTSWGFLSMYMRLRAVRRDMTLLVRRMALDEADRDQPDRGT